MVKGSNAPMSGNQAMDAYVQSAENFSPEAESEKEVTIKNFPKLKDGAFYGIAGEFTKFAVEDSEADPAAVLVTFLTFAGAVFGNSRFALVGPEKHPPRLFAAIVGASSRARKGTSLGPVRLLFKTLFAKFPDLDLVISPGPLSSGEGLAFAVRDASEEKDKDNQPVDSGVVDKRLLVTESELSAALKAARRESNTLSSILRTAWDNGNLAPLTKRDRIKATGAHICVVGHITQEELSSLLTQSDIYNGFANRILWTCARRKRLVPIPRPLDKSKLEQFANRLATAIQTSNYKGQSEDAKMSFDQEASVLWRKIYPNLSQDKPGEFGVVTARAEPQVLRLALIYALLDQESEIKKQHVIAALDLWDYCSESAAYLFGNSSQNPIMTKILDFLKSGRKTQTEINKHLNGHVSAVQLGTHLSHLQAVGRISSIVEPADRGRAKTFWQLTEGFKVAE